MQGDARLDVWSEVVQPFHLMPRFMLEGTSNAVMGALVSGLLPRFMDRSACCHSQHTFHTLLTLNCLASGRMCGPALVMHYLHSRPLQQLRSVMCRLGNDYKRWATDPAYRETRKAAAQHGSLSR